MRLRRGRIYHIRCYDHNEDTGKVDKNPEFVINIVGRYRGSTRAYYILENWWPRRKQGDKVANILKKAIIDVRELK